LGAELNLDEQVFERNVNEVGDDRDNIQPGDQVILIVENDIGFARFLLDTARERGFKGLVTSMGVNGLVLAEEYKPHAITLDIFLPDIEGWRVLERFKNDLSTRHIPVCVISTDDSRERALAGGAFIFVAKPVQSKDVLEGMLDHLLDYMNRRKKSVLLFESDVQNRNRILEHLDLENLDIATPTDAASAQSLMNERQFDCIVMSPRSSNGTAGSTAWNLPETKSLSRLPLILYGDGETGLVDETQWKNLQDRCTVRRVKSPERLLDLTSIFLHVPLTVLPPAKRQLLHDLHQSDKVLAGKKVLIVDDDMRNIFALSSILEDHEMIVLSADNGRDAIKILQLDSEIDIVLMDIMMPEMDGIQTMREIRKISNLKNVPIVAVTAKAMKGDREKCIAAGAWDYLAKPVDPEQMLSVLRAWLHR
jgi:CheY-like chemotaxis protein